MSGFIFRFALGAVAAAWALEAAAQDRPPNRAAFNDPASSTEAYSAERAAPPGAEGYDSYVADPAESYVTEGDDAPAMTAPPREAPPMAALEPRWEQRDPAPTCRAYFPVGPGRDRSGTLCEQTDGALRIVEAPLVGVSPRNLYAAAPSQYCREYQQAVVAGGVERVAYGKACWQRDGSWQIVSAPALAAAPRDYAYAPEYAAPRPRAYPQRPRPTRPEYAFGDLFGWLHPRDERY